MPAGCDVEYLSLTTADPKGEFLIDED